MRLWNTNYPDVYGGIATQKVRLARRIGEAFRAKGFIATNDRPIRDEWGAALTDVDVAVAAPDEGALAIIEAKWPIAPDSLKEMRKADDEVERGIGQLEAVRALGDRSQDELLRQLFPGHPTQSWRITKTLYVLAVRGFYPTA